MLKKVLLMVIDNNPYGCKADSTRSVMLLLLQGMFGLVNKLCSSVLILEKYFQMLYCAIGMHGASQRTKHRASPCSSAYNLIFHTGKQKGRGRGEFARVQGENVQSGQYRFAIRACPQS